MGVENSLCLTAPKIALAATTFEKKWRNTLCLEFVAKSFDHFTDGPEGIFL